MNVGWDELQSTVAIVLLACTSIMTIYNTFKMVREVHAPSAERLRRLEEVERSMEQYGHELDELKQAQRLNLKAQTVIIDHLTGGNHTEQLNNIREEINGYLISRIGD